MALPSVGGMDFVLSFLKAFLTWKNVLSKLENKIFRFCLNSALTSWFLVPLTGPSKVKTFDAESPRKVSIGSSCRAKSEVVYTGCSKGHDIFLALHLWLEEPA